MSVHFVHKFKGRHERRRKFFTTLVKEGKATYIKKTKTYWLVDTLGTDYLVSNRGNVIRQPKRH